MQGTRRDLQKLSSSLILGTVPTLHLLHFKSAFSISHKMFKLADSRRGNHCRGIASPSMFLEGWRWSVHALYAEHTIQSGEKSQWGTGLTNALISAVLLRHGCFLDTLGHWKLRKIRW